VIQCQAEQEVSFQPGGIVRFPQETCAGFPYGLADRQPQGTQRTQESLRPALMCRCSQPQRTGPSRSLQAELQAAP